MGMQLKQNVLCYFHTLCTQAVDGCSPAGLTPAAIRGGVEGCAICIIVQEASTAWSAYCTNKVAASTYVPRLHDTREIYLSATRCFDNCGTLKEVNTGPSWRKRQQSRSGPVTRPSSSVVYIRNMAAALKESKLCALYSKRQWRGLLVDRPDSACCLQP